MKKINVLIVDDSAFMRKLIMDFLEEDDRIQVIGTARNGQDALKKIEELHPDVVTLDVEMPVMNGLETLKRIMKTNPIPVVMLSSTTYGGAYNTVLAMQYGAVDFIAKPSGAISLDLHKVKEQLVKKVVLASKANLHAFRMDESLSFSQTTSFLSDKNSSIELYPSSDNRVIPVKVAKSIVCIGTSTGGPKALQEVLTHLPKGLGAPILIVQHMPPGFTKSLASRLNSLSDLNVKEAEDGEIFQRDTAYIAPGGYHLTVRKMGTALTAHLNESEPRKGHRPSVDVLFESISQLKDYKKIAVILTGMGADGTEGLKTLKSVGNTVAIAESEETSIVYGMPKSAIGTGLVDEVQPLTFISNTISQYLQT
ncbi:chemotaxis response regulator protein-glutamate methylesterase [Bacillus songklensis]|uniref:Protein-glutamate methylesterase/protein-glutamine glutaminase n=1 Tax=Bacillus songklensis TaxID=1069116 RepID=A0ABV8AX48_9BACI